MYLSEGSGIYRVRPPSRISIVSRGCKVLEKAETLVVTGILGLRGAKDTHSLNRHIVKE